MTISLTPAQCTALARLIRLELTAYAEADLSPEETGTVNRTGDPFTGSDLDVIAPLLEILEGRFCGCTPTASDLLRSA